jgi:hypothetical protein
MVINTIEGKLEVVWHEDVKAVVDTWTSYSISLEDFKEAILDKAVPYAKEHGGIAWIVDSTKSKGVFSKEIQDFIVSDIFPNFAKVGIKYFMTTSSDEAVTRLTVSQYKKQVGPAGIQLVEVSDVASAKEWLKNNS